MEKITLKMDEKAIPDTDLPSHLVVFAGQSNMFGHTSAIGGDKSLNSAVFAWNNAGEAGEWLAAELGQPPFNTNKNKPNNAAYHFCDQLQRETGGNVFLVGTPVNGSTLLSWSSSDAPNMRRLLSELKYALSTSISKKAGIETIDSFLWIQGESDDEKATMVKEQKVETLEKYKVEFSGMISCLLTMPFWSCDATKVIAGELVQDGWLAARNDFYSNNNNWPSDCIMGVASSAELSDIGDKAHFDGISLQEMGYRMYKVSQTLISD